MGDASCSYPHCDAAEMLKEIKESNKDYRGEIKNELKEITDGVKKLLEFMTRIALLEQAIQYLRDGEAENKAAHIVLFRKIEELESRTGTRMWDMVRLFVTLGAGLLIGKLT